MLVQLFDFREILVVILIFVPLERLIPARADQRLLRRHWKNDLIFLFVNGIVCRIGFLLLTGGIIALIDAHGPTAISTFVAARPLWLQVVAAVMIADMGFYVAHRLFHAVPFLWRFHAIHHSIEELDWLAAHRVHPLDQIATSAASVLPLYALGFPAPAIAIYGLIYLLQSHLLHANVRLPLGPLNWIIATPHSHRWHHAYAVEGRGCNFGAQLIFMDSLFGTLRLPEAAPKRYGISDPVPVTYAEQLAWPLARPPAPGRMESL